MTTKRNAFKGAILLLCCVLFSSITTPATVYASTPTAETWYYRLEGGQAIITGFQCDLDEIDLVIPSNLDGYTVVGVGRWAFTTIDMPFVAGNHDPVFRVADKIRSVTFPDTLRIIENQAFSGCSKLESVFIPKWIEQIESIPFASCKALKEIKVDPQNLFYKDINGVLFTKDMKNLVQYPDGLTNSTYTIPEGVEEAYYTLALNNNFIKTIFIPASMSSLSVDGLTNLESFTVHPDNLFYKVIDDALYDLRNTERPYDPCLIRLSKTSSSKHFVVQKGITYISNGAFRDCKNLESIEFPEGFWALGGRLFEGSSVKNIFFPKSVLFHGSSYDCPSIERIDVHPDNTKYKSIEGVLYNKDQTVMMVYPQGKRDKVFVVPHGVIELETSAIVNNPYLEVIHLPETLTKISGANFNGCENLKKSYFYGPPPSSTYTVAPNTFMPEGTEVIYLKAYESDYQRIIQNNSSCNPNDLNIFLAFSDLPTTHWAHPYVSQAVAMDVLDVGNISFNAGTAATRLDFIIWIVRALGLKELSTEKAPFYDMAGISEANQLYVNIAWQHGLVKGEPGLDSANNGVFLFSGAASITREQATAMLVRVLLGQNYENVLSKIDFNLSAKAFKDFNSVSDWAKPYILFTQDKNIVQGDAAGNFNPLLSISRGESITLIVRSVYK